MELKRVYIFLFDGYSDWEISYLAPELHKSKKIDLKTFSLNGDAIVSMGGLKITPDLGLKDINSKDVSVLVLPGGPAWEQHKIQGIDQFVEEVYTSNKIIAAICAGTTFLGQKGYLDQIKHTSNALDYLKKIAPNYKGEKNYQNELAVKDKNIITANGIAPIEFAVKIFKEVNLHSESDIENWYQLFKNGVWSS